MKLSTTTTLTIKPWLKRTIIGLFVFVVTILTTAGACKSEEYTDREAQQQQKEQQTTNTQEKANLREKIKRDEASSNKVATST